MARKPTTRKLTRRDAVALLGAGTVMGVARPAPVNARQVPKGEPFCDQAAEVGTYSRSGHHAIISYSCCDETRNAVLVGVQEPQRQPNNRGKAHLKPLRDRLTSDKLEEYCFMVWGLSEKQAKQLFESLPIQMDLTKRDAPK